MAQTFVGMARTWLAMAVIIFRVTGGFGMGSGFVPSHPILPGHVVSASSGWTQIFEVHGLGLVQMHLFHYRLEFRHGFRSLLLPGRLRRGLVGVSTSDMGKVPGGFGTTRAAPLWFSFTSGGGNCSFSSSHPGGNLPSVVPNRWLFYHGWTDSQGSSP